VLAALLSASITRLLGAAIVTAFAVVALARLGRRQGGRWPVLGALVLGQDEDDEPSTGPDLRFAAVVASVASALAWVLALDDRFRALSGSSRALALALGLPIVTVLVTTAADLLGRDAPAAPASPPAPDSEPAPAPAPAPASEPTPASATRPPLDSGALRRPAIERDEVRRLIDAALDAVGAARARTADGAVRDGLSSLEETLAEYGILVDDQDADLERIAQRAREAAALAEACQDDESEAFRTLGLRRDATTDQAKRVYRELAKIYHADASVPGADPEKFKEIAAAYEKVRAALAERSPAAASGALAPAATSP
jgi:hypothetical protein